MKTTAVTISYDDEKLSAIKIYMQQRDFSLEEEIIKAIDSFYAKYVPSNVREFLELRNGEKTLPKVKKSKPLVLSAEDQSPWGDSK